MTSLGILEEIKDLRTVWPHEALDFTPWLSQDENWDDDDDDDDEFFFLTWEEEHRKGDSSGGGCLTVFVAVGITLALSGGLTLL